MWLPKPPELLSYDIDNHSKGALPMPLLRNTQQEKKKYPSNTSASGKYTTVCVQTDKMQPTPLNLVDVYKLWVNDHFLKVVDVSQQ